MSVRCLVYHFHQNFTLLRTPLQTLTALITDATAEASLPIRSVRPRRQLRKTFSLYLVPISQLVGKLIRGESFVCIVHFYRFRCLFYVAACVVWRTLVSISDDLHDGLHPILYRPPVFLVAVEFMTHASRLSTCKSSPHVLFELFISLAICSRLITYFSCSSLRCWPLISQLDITLKATTSLSLDVRIAPNGSCIKTK